MIIKGRGIRVGANFLDIEDNYVVNSILHTNNNVSILRNHTALTQIQLTSANGSGVIELLLPSLLTVDYSVVIETGDLQDLDLSALQTIGDAFQVNYMTMTSNLDLSSLVSVLNSINISNCPNLPAIIMPSLSSCDTLAITDNPSLVNVNIPTLSTVNTVSISRNSSLDTIDVDPSVFNCLSINFQENMLTQTNVDDILLAVDTAGLTGGELLLDGGANSSPTGGVGNTEYLSLIGKGWTVAIN